MILKACRPEIPECQVDYRFGSPCFQIVPTHKYSRELEAVENALVSWCRAAGVEITITSRLRTCSEQLALFNARRTSAAPTTSQHEFGYAFDAVPSRQGLRAAGATFPQGLQWIAAVVGAWGVPAIVETDHTHVQWYQSKNWKLFLRARDLAGVIPTPRKR